MSDAGQADLEVYPSTQILLCCSNPLDPCPPTPPFTFILQILTRGCLLAAPGTGLPSVPGAANEWPLLSFHHSVSQLIRRPRLFSGGIFRALPGGSWCQQHCSCGDFIQQRNSITFCVAIAAPTVNESTSLHFHPPFDSSCKTLFISAGCLMPSFTPADPDRNTG